MYLFARELFGSGSAYGANTRTSAALNASICVDDHLAVLFADCLYGACAYASAASDTFVGNLICHVKTPPLMIYYIVA